MYFIRLFSLSLILIGLIIIFICFFITRKNDNKPEKKDGSHNFCFLIPARYESKVIEDLLIRI